MEDTRAVNLTGSPYYYDIKKELASLAIDFDKPININKFEQIMNAKDKSLIVLDTNVLFSIVLKSYYTGLNILRILETCKNIIWIPHHVYIEYNINKAGIFNSLIKKEDKLINLLNKSLKSSKNTLQNLITTQLNVVDATIIELEEELNSKYDDLYNIIANYESKLKKEVVSVNTNNNELKNKLERFVNELSKDNRISENIKFSEYLEILNEGETRYKYLLPPGYKDNCKGTRDDNTEEKIYNNKFGDLFIWKEILKLPKKIKKDRELNIENIIFITNDLKEDWWKLDDKSHDDKDPTLLRDELLLEFRELNPDTSINFMRLSRFYEYASEIYGLYNSDVYIELNKDDEEYIDRIKDKLANKVINQINNDNFIGELYFEDAGIDTIHAYKCDYKNIIRSNFSKKDEAVIINYELEFIVDLVGHSSEHNMYSCYNMHGPLEVKEHNMSLSVIVSVDRIIENTKSDNLIQELKKDNEYKNFKIINAKIIKYKVSREEDKYSDNECLDEDEFSSSEGFICPKCSRMFKDRSNDMGDECLECYQAEDGTNLFI